MNPRQLGALVRLAGAMPGRLRQPITPEAAELNLASQLAGREHQFLDMARRLIFARPESPLRRLLAWAGCGFDDLRTEVATHGLESTLVRLRDAGVRLSLDEFRGRTPIVRSGLSIETRDSDFDNHGLKGDGISGTTSGSRGAASRVLYDWDFLAEEAAHEVLLYRHHGVLDAPLALWYPVLPGVAGVHNLLLNLVAARPPERWFSQVDPASTPRLSLPRISLAGLRLGGRLAGMRVPAPEFAGVGAADRVLDWMAEVHRRGLKSTVRTFASSAVKLAQRAAERGVDISGATIFAGGEPLSVARRRFIEGTGARVVPRYVATETGLIGAACLQTRGGDDMHLYQGRLAVIPGEGDDPTDTAGRCERLLFTTLTATTARLLLNTDLGDAGVISTRQCRCDFGRLGFDRRLEQIGSLDRLTLEGMTVGSREFESLVAALVTARGGGPDGFQYRVEADPSTGRERLVLALSPAPGGIVAPRFLEALYEAMAGGGAGLALASDIWRDAGTISITWETIRTGAGSKHSPRVQAPAESATAAGAGEQR